MQDNTPLWQLDEEATGAEEDELGPWDDRTLINAYDEAIKKYKVMHLGQDSREAGLNNPPQRGPTDKSSQSQDKKSKAKERKSLQSAETTASEERHGGQRSTSEGGACKKGPKDTSNVISDVAEDFTDGSQQPTALAGLSNEDAWAQYTAAMRAYYGSSGAEGESQAYNTNPSTGSNQPYPDYYNGAYHDWNTASSNYYNHNGYASNDGPVSQPGAETQANPIGTSVSNSNPYHNASGNQPYPSQEPYQQESYTGASSRTPWTHHTPPHTAHHLPHNQFPPPPPHHLPHPYHPGPQPFTQLHYPPPQYPPHPFYPSPYHPPLPHHPLHPPPYPAPHPHHPPQPHHPPHPYHPPPPHEPPSHQYPVPPFSQTSNRFPYPEPPSSSEYPGNEDHPPPPPALLAGMQETELADLLMAWYYAGYYTGKLSHKR